MFHTDVLEIYKGMFDLGKIDTWFANGYNSVRVRYVDSEVVFTYIDKRDWKLETLDNHIINMGQTKKKTRKDLKNRGR